MKPDQPTRSRTLLSLVIVIGLVPLALLLVVVNRQALVDHVIAYQQRDNQTVAQYARALKTTDRGTFLLRASRAQVNQRDDFNAHCGNLVEKTVVIGCYSKQRIYVYDVSNPQLAGIKEVTMAHELLHAAYERLGSKERSILDEHIRRQYGAVRDEHFRATVKSYETLEPGEQLNELHSMLATEQEDISPELETYYKQYFSDRKAIVVMARKYDTVFRELEAKQKALVDELNGIADTLEAAIPAYERQVDSLDSEISAFNARAERGDFPSSGAFNAARSRLVARQAELETERRRINELVARHEAGKKELDALNTQASTLHKSIDSLQTRKVPTL